MLNRHENLASMMRTPRLRVMADCASIPRLASRHEALSTHVSNCIAASRPRPCTLSDSDSVSPDKRAQTVEQTERSRNHSSAAMRTQDQCASNRPQNQGVSWKGNMLCVFVPNLRRRTREFRVDVQ